MSELNIGEVLKNRREEMELTQIDIVNRLQTRGCSMSRETLSKIENDNRNVSAIELNHLCNILNLGMNDFFQEEEDLVTLYRRKVETVCTDEMVEGLNKVQEIVKTFLQQKEIYDKDIRRVIPKQRWGGSKCLQN